MSNNLKKRIEKIEQSVHSGDTRPLVAMQYPDGSYEYQGQIYEDEKAFDRAMDAILGDNPTKPLVILTEYADRKEVPDET